MLQTTFLQPVVEGHADGTKESDVLVGRADVIFVAIRIVLDARQGVEIAGALGQFHRPDRLDAAQRGFLDLQWSADGHRQSDACNGRPR